ncbi:carbonic anhydrase [Desarmillaria tabescens]|uniref:Carbonic anhydrase n=1 Tax=Armillaria tabescens TaxID=1929756 RepID=A0AA39NDS5_ARMTA|nr:carbonic anhydrase [Desarmillaria tabescens]KAK0463746.1 carbonic anhydrase [Desarmillaria tabescens]
MLINKAAAAPSLPFSSPMICSSIFLLACVTLSLGDPIIYSRTRNTVRDLDGWDALSDGNENFRSEMESSYPGMLEDLAVNGQHPEFMFLGCSDSRVSEGTIFDALPGMLFGERNIANQFHENDTNSNAVLAYSVEGLGVQHIIVMGHHGCGGVSAAIASPPSQPWDVADAAVQEWILPLRKLYAQSTRPEIVEYRNKYPGGIDVPPKLHEPVLRALVEENVKETVSNIASSQLIVERYSNTTSAAVFIHGLVYDVENGEITNLDVSVGPPGISIPPVPFHTHPHHRPQRKVSLVSVLQTILFGRHHEIGN